jgi:hypothetical protein
MVIPLPPCFAKKRLEDIDNKGSALANARKKRLYVVENIEGLFAERMQETTPWAAGWESRGWRAGRARNLIQDGNLMRGLLRRSWSILLVRYLNYKRY